jgi:LuxR family transcriptional regulator, maltose regulon positive regulatory protein
LPRSDPSLVAELHRRASAWHRAHGDAGEAISHATTAGDFADACELIARHWRPVWNLGHRETLAAWIDALPRGAVLADPRVCLARGWTSLFLGRSDEVERWIRAAEGGAPPGPFYDGSVSVEENAAVLRCTQAYFSGDVGRSIAEGRRALTLDPEGASPVRAVNGLVLALPLYLAGELTPARELLEDAHRRLTARGWAETLVATLGALAAVRFDAGELAPAEHALAEAERVMAELGLDESPSGTLVRFARGRLLEQRGDTAGAASAFERAAVLARRAGRRLDHANALIAHSRLERRRDHAKARSLARRRARCSPPAPIPACSPMRSRGRSARSSSRRRVEPTRSCRRIPI